MSATIVSKRRGRLLGIVRFVGDPLFWLWVVAATANAEPGLAPIADTDGDGMPDFWELRYFGGPTNGVATADADGPDNLSEYRAETDPTDAQSFFRIGGIGAQSAVSITTTSSVGRVYSLQERSDPVAGAWANLPDQGPRPGVGGPDAFTDPAAPERRFHRIDVSTAPTFEPEPVPDLQTTSDSTNTPFYIFLFVHTEDHINHPLSEMRFTRLAPVVAQLAEDHPEAGLVWTIEFQGADAKTVYERNPVTGIADMLIHYADQGVVEFGYHAHHDPTYLERPQKLITDVSTWAEKVQAMDTWVSCEKDPYFGGCVVPGAGGPLAIENNFGPVQIVSGLYLYQECAVEHDADAHAVKKYLPDRVLGFGYPDHGSTTGAESYDELLDALMTILAPSVETSGTMFWADNVLRINDGYPINGVRSLNTIEGIVFNRVMIESMDRSRPHVLNAHLGSKYHYTAEGASPTQWAYAHPPPPADNPWLPPEWINPPALIEQNYSNSIAVLTHLVETVLPANPGSKFVDSRDVIELVAPPEYRVVSREKLDVLARWVILKWDDGPPNYVSDGFDFYSLRDTFVLLAKALADGYAESVELTDCCGPFDVEGPAQLAIVSASDIVAAARSIAPDFSGGATWQITPPNTLGSSYTVGEAGVNPAQLLYAMAAVYASTCAGTPVPAVDLPTGRAMPETAEILESLGCSDCQGRAWSLKPARIRVP